MNNREHNKQIALELYQYCANIALDRTDLTTEGARRREAARLRANELRHRHNLNVAELKTLVTAGMRT